MSQQTEEKKNLVVYDYTTKEVPIKEEGMYLDCIETFGWELVSKERGFLYSILNFRRDRKLKANMELKNLQRKFEDEVDAIRKLEADKTKTAGIASLTIGTIGALTLGGGMALCMLNPASIPLLTVGIAIGVIGIVVLAIAYPIYIKMVKKNVKRVSSLIEEKYDKIANMLVEANSLLNGTSN